MPSRHVVPAHRAVPPESGELTHRERVAALLSVLPRDAVLVGAGAAWAMRAWVPVASDVVEVNVHPPGSVRGRTHDGVVLSARRYPPADVVRRRDALVTTPLRTAVDLARRNAPLVDVVPLLDAVLRVGRLQPADARLVIDAEAGMRGDSRARAALDASDPAAESPRESLLRLVVVELGVPAPVVQHAVVAPDRRRYRLDLAWPLHRVALEHDGAAFHGPDRRSADLCALLG